MNVLGLLLFPARRRKPAARTPQLGHTLNVPAAVQIMHMNTIAAHHDLLDSGLMHPPVGLRMQMKFNVTEQRILDGTAMRA